MHFLKAIISDLSVLIVCNKTGGTIKGDKKINKGHWNIYVCSLRYLDDEKIYKTALC